MKAQKFVIFGLLSVGFLSLLVAVTPILSPNPNADQKAITWGGLGVGAEFFPWRDRLPPVRRNQR